MIWTDMILYFNSVLHDLPLFNVFLIIHSLKIVTVFFYLMGIKFEHFLVKVCITSRGLSLEHPLKTRKKAAVPKMSVLYSSVVSKGVLRNFSEQLFRVWRKWTNLNRGPAWRYKIVKYITISSKRINIRFW